MHAPGKFHPTNTKFNGKPMQIMDIKRVAGPCKGDGTKD